MDRSEEKRPRETRTLLPAYRVECVDPHPSPYALTLKPGDIVLPLEPPVGEWVKCIHPTKGSPRVGFVRHHTILPLCVEEPKQDASLLPSQSYIPTTSIYEDHIVDDPVGFHDTRIGFVGFGEDGSVIGPFDRMEKKREMEESHKNGISRLKQSKFLSFDAGRHRDPISQWHRFSQECIPLVGNPLTRVVGGLLRGIQGCDNSCFIDSIIFALFGCNSFFDFLLHPLYKDATVTKSSILKQPPVDLVRPALSLIVKSLRSRHFVPYEYEQHLRLLLDGKYHRSMDDILEFASYFLSILEYPPPFPSLQQPKDAIPAGYVLHLTGEGAEQRMPSMQEAFQAALKMVGFGDAPPPPVLLLGLPRMSSEVREVAEVMEPQRTLVFRSDRVVETSYVLSAVCAFQHNHFMAFARDEEGDWYFMNSMMRMFKGDPIPYLSPCPIIRDRLKGRMGRIPLQYPESLFFKTPPLAIYTREDTIRSTP
eukprot:TRINITY_DN2678_c0_g1_i5.p1 TRINITY_DN2678_c0_g1~~TRINITY_DN2678_c0_g1_i5.p1  ORF type:complete len:491 (+),score=109.40 TRINITY_DN2678_c0_g1_i5:39-1475(+)